MSQSKPDNIWFRCAARDVSLLLTKIWTLRRVFKNMTLCYPADTLFSARDLSRPLGPFGRSGWRTLWGNYMKTNITRLITVAAVFALAGCTDFYEPTPKVTKVQDTWIISGTAALSDTFVHGAYSRTYSCTEPPPDSAFNQGDSADLNFSILSVGGGSDSSSDGTSESSEETELAGRTPGVLMSRELFFRACEFSHNFKLSKEEALTLYNKTLDIVDKNWAAEAAQTTVTIGDKITTTQGAVVNATSTQANDSSATPSATGTTSSTSSSSASECPSGETYDPSTGGCS
ncbi:MAG: hypothetical protein ACPGRZ_00645 [Alphaproteobacteria bacterium]